MQEYDSYSGAILRCHREYMGVVQEELAEVLDRVNLRTYRRWEQGSDRIPVDVLDRVRAMVDRFDAELAQLINERPEVVVVRRSGLNNPGGGMVRMLAVRAMRELPGLAVPCYIEDAPPAAEKSRWSHGLGVERRVLFGGDDMQPDDGRIDHRRD